METKIHPNIINPMRQNKFPISKSRFIAMMFVMLIMYSLIFLFAGNWIWIRGWLFTATTLLWWLSAFYYLLKKNPEVIRARAQRHKGTKKWDKIWMVIYLPFTLVTIYYSAYQGGRSPIDQIPNWLLCIGFIFYIFGLFIVTWAESVNPFFEPTVRIQKDRNQRVIQDGPYKYIRHPGYLGGIFIFIGIPLILNSFRGMMGSIVCIFLFLLRTWFEDKILISELEGYRDYSKRIKFRLIPNVW